MISCMILAALGSCLAVTHGVFMGNSASALLQRWAPGSTQKEGVTPWRDDTVRRFVAARILIEMPNNVCIAQIAENDDLNVFVCSMHRGENVVRVVLPSNAEASHIRDFIDWHADRFPGVAITAAPNVEWL